MLLNAILLPPGQSVSPRGEANRTLSSQDAGDSHVEFRVVLSGLQEVPPHYSAYRGSGWFTLDTHVLNYAVGINFPIFFPIGAGIYGQAPVGVNGPLIFDWSGYAIFFPVPDEPNSGGLAYGGGYLLSAEQVQQLKRGLWYVNISSAQFPDGELRGQILPFNPDDTDGDGVLNDQDLCPDTPPGGVVDAGGCSIEQLCPCNAPWRNHAEFVKCVKDEAKRFRKEHLITEKERKEIVKEAEESDCPPPRPNVPPGTFPGPGSQ
jgi:hypothetical protein